MSQNPTEEKSKWNEAMNGPETKRDQFPPCSKWKIWMGQEVEGTTQVDELTLFIRELPVTKGNAAERFSSLVALKRLHGINFKRIWFCKEFADHEVMRMICQFYQDATKCVEMDQFYSVLPPDLRARVTVYWKQPLNLRPGDFICVGRPFNDESFEIGTGARVVPDMYLKDEQVY